MTPADLVSKLLEVEGGLSVHEGMLWLEDGEAITLRELLPSNTPIDQAYRNAARRDHDEDGELELDDGAVVSISEDGGAYVQMWRWVSAMDAGLCSCGNPLDDGEGFDGQCGSCADRKEQDTPCQKTI